jgi:hypothetical protein
LPRERESDKSGNTYPPPMVIERKFQKNHEKYLQVPGKDIVMIYLEKNRLGLNKNMECFIAGFGVNL